VFGELAWLDISQSIGTLVHLAGFVLDGKMEGLKELNPLGMFRIELVLALNVHYSLMIRMQDKLTSH